MWQDWVIAGLQVWFTLALLPSILSKTHKPSLKTSLLNVFGVVIFVTTVFTLQLYIAALLMSLNAVAWGILAWQRWQLDRASASF